MVRNTIFAERDRRAKLAVDAQRTLYRHELGTAGAERHEHLQGIDAANTRITGLLPGAVDAGVPVAEIARLTGYSRPTLYRMLEKERPAQDKAGEFAYWAEALATASKQVGHAAMRNELTTAAGIDVEGLCAALIGLFDYALSQLLALDSVKAVPLLELVGNLPHEEKVVLTQLFFQKMSLEAVVHSMGRPQADVVVWAVLGMLRVLPALDDTSG